MKLKNHLNAEMEDFLTLRIEANQLKTEATR